MTSASYEDYVAAMQKYHEGRERIRDRAERAEADRDAALRKIAAVEHAIREAEEGCDDMVGIADLRAALDAGADQ